ncbi:S8 family serine peptidase [Natronoarchaeum sp. GCM10025703]|uniref:S8 family serine peptidase n=1 Tax=unclassified Natronoarchaeum TaxID=2620183 RepID=UPI00360F6132
MEHYELLEGGPIEGDTADIAILDSISEASEEFREYNTIGRELDAINAGDSNTHGHGVAHIIGRYADNTKFHFYQTIHPNGNFKDRDLLKTFGIIQHVIGEIDVINFSAGLDHAANPHKDCDRSGPSCKVCRVLEDLLDDHTVFVAASGDQLQTDGLVCPGLSSEVLSTGGVTAKCTAEIKQEDKTISIGPGTDQPAPNAFWIKRSDNDGAQGTYCTNRGCYPGTSCIENRRYEQWEHNHEPAENSPDVLAPVHLPIEDEIGPLLAQGSSFSAPIVSSQIANVISGLQSVGVSTTRQRIKQNIIEHTKGAFSSGPGMLCGVDFATETGNSYDLDLEFEDTTDLFFTTTGSDCNWDDS